LIFGIKEGSSGNLGGRGNSGIVGKSGKFGRNARLRSSPRLVIGGLGRFGIFGRSIFAGWKLKEGRRIFIPMLIFEKSKVISGILKFGI
jgi:hypothetical protein